MIEAFLFSTSILVCIGLDTFPKFNSLTQIYLELFNSLPYMVKRIALYGIMEDIRVRGFKFWESDQFYTKCLC